MTPPTVLEDEGDRIVVRKRAGKTRGPARDPDRRGAQRRDARHGRVCGTAEGRRRTASAGGAGRAAGRARRQPAPRSPRVADRHRPGRPDVPRRGRGAGSQSRSSASGRSTRSSSSPATSSGSSSKAAAACSPPRRSSRRRGRSRSRGAFAASRSTSRCCEASGSLSSRFSRTEFRDRARSWLCAVRSSASARVGQAATARRACDWSARGTSLSSTIGKPQSSSRISSGTSSAQRPWPSQAIGFTRSFTNSPRCWATGGP